MHAFDASFAKYFDQQKIAGMGKIILDGMEFRAPIGVMEHEQQYGNWINVSATLEGNGINGMSDSLAETIDYGEIYAIIREKVAEPASLLEYAAKKMISAIKEKFEHKLDRIVIRIEKVNPPLPGIVNASIVELTWELGMP